jgi:hypothetical protein
MKYDRAILAYQISVSTWFTGKGKSYLFHREKIPFPCYINNILLFEEEQYI